MATNLPHALTSFVGRDAELDEVAHLLATSRLLTLTGPGGAGKTRLALQAADAAAAAHPDGTLLVELGRIEDARLVPGALLATLDASEEPGEAPLDTAVRELGDRRALVVLDNCEHLQDASAGLAETLLVRCPHVRLLVTSRESPLGVPGETVWSVPPMALPGGDARDELERSDAVQLFVGRARQALPDFTLDDEAGLAVARICRSLDGMPLAIELAAARLRMLSATQIADGLSDRFRLLTGGARGALPRHRTLRGSIEWSHELLGEDERTLLRRLSAFAGGFTLDAVEAVCSGAALARADVLDLVGTLVDKSLITTERRDEALRYRLLETVRQYAAERLVEAGERDAVLLAHVTYFSALAQDADRLRLQAGGRSRLAVEEPNLRAALEHAAVADPASALAIAAGLGRWWIERDTYREGRAACARALASGQAGEWPALRSRVHWSEGMLALYQVDFEAAVAAIAGALEYAEVADDARTLGRAHALAAAAFACMAPADGVRHATSAVELLRPLGDENELAWALAPLATAHAATDDYAAARATAEECAALADRTGDFALGGWAEWILGVVLTFQGELRPAVEHLQRGLALVGGGTPVVQGLALGARLVADAALGHAAAVEAEGARGLERAIVASALGEAAMRPGLGLVKAALGNLEEAAVLTAPAAASAILYFEGNAHDALAKLALARGDGAAALEHATALANLAEFTTNPRFLAQAAYTRGRAALLAGAVSEGRGHLHDALAELVRIGARLHAVDTFEALAVAAAAGERWSEAARLLGAAEAERGRLEAGRVPPEAEWLGAASDGAAAELGRSAFDAVWQEGAALSFDEAVAYARRARGPRDRPARGWEALTPVESRVANLAAEGLTNPEIGERLFVSRSTVKVHLSRAFAKLGVANRTELARARATSDPR